MLCRSTMASLIQLITAAMFLAALPLARVEATPITFTFEGTATGFRNTRPETAPFTAVPVSITANADTLNIVMSGGVFSLDTNSAMRSPSQALEQLRTRLEHGSSSPGAA